MTTTPTFDATDETAFDNDRALTAEHGRRFVRNSLAIWNERCGHVGSAEQLVGDAAEALTTRRIATAGWAYVGPWVYFCPVPVGLPNGARPVGSIRLLLTGRNSVVSPNGTNLYLLNQTLNAPGEGAMDRDINDGLNTEQWAELGGEEAWSATLTVPVVPGRNVLWLAVRCAILEETEVDLSSEFGGPYLAEFSLATTIGSSHPALFAADTEDADATAYAVRVSRSSFEFALGVYDTYTVPMAVAVAGGDETAGQYLLWEPFRSQLARIQPPLTSDEWTVNPARAVVAFRYDLVVVDIDSATVDGSQVWVLEDYQFGAGLRWWQLTSAVQFRSATELVAVARRAVVPQVCMVQPVIRVGGFAPYPLPATGGKPRQWLHGAPNGTAGGIMVDLNDQPPFAIPTDTRTLRIVVPVAVVLWRSGTRREAVELAFTARVLNTFTAAEAVAEVVVTSVPILESGGMDGGSVLARTIGWAALTGSTGTRYGTEGLTLRSDWYRWTLIELSVVVPVSVFTGDVTGSDLLIDIAADDAGDYWLAVGSIAVVMEGR